MRVASRPRDTRMRHERADRPQCAVGVGGVSGCRLETGPVNALNVGFKRTERDLFHCVSLRVTQRCVHVVFASIERT